MATARCIGVVELDGSRRVVAGVALEFDEIEDFETGVT
jgi:hypothetical protein